MWCNKGNNWEKKMVDMTQFDIRKIECTASTIIDCI